MSVFRRAEPCRGKRLHRAFRGLDDERHGAIHCRNVRCTHRRHLRDGIVADFGQYHVLQRAFHQHDRQGLYLRGQYHADHRAVLRIQEAVLSACPDIPVYQIGKADEPHIAGARHDYLGTPLATAIALVANATLHLGVDSFANHLTHYEWIAGESGLTRRVLALVLWGSTQASAASYPHNTNISLGLACQPCFREDPKVSRVARGPCINPPDQTYDWPRHACMHGIPAARVSAELRRLWAAPSTSV
jgi:hypothetical protein